MKTTSWVVIEKSSGSAILETYSQTLIEGINLEKYKAVPIMEYLQSINKSLKTI